MEGLKKLSINGNMGENHAAVSFGTTKEEGLQLLRDQYASSAARVDEHMFISGYLAAADDNFIKTNGVKFILKMFADSNEYYGGMHRHSGVEYMIIPAIDHPEYDIAAAIPAAMAFISKAKGLNQKILIHCHMGISRSATVILSYLMAFHGMNLEGALSFLKHKRPIVNPNQGFLKFLKKMESCELVAERFLVINVAVD